MTPKLNSSFHGPYFLCFKLFYFLSVFNYIVKRIGADFYFVLKLSILRTSAASRHVRHIATESLHFSRLYIWHTSFSFLHHINNKKQISLPWISTSCYLPLPFCFCFNFVFQATKYLASVGIPVGSSAFPTDELEAILSWGLWGTSHLFECKVAKCLKESVIRNSAF